MPMWGTVWSALGGLTANEIATGGYGLLVATNQFLITAVPGSQVFSNAINSDNAVDASIFGLQSALEVGTYAVAGIEMAAARAVVPISSSIVEKLAAKSVIKDNWAKKIFGSRDGHLLDTPQNRKLLQNVTDDPKTTLGSDRHGNVWSGKNLDNGTQVWTQTRQGEIINGGVNKTPHHTPTIQRLAYLRKQDQIGNKSMIDQKNKLTLLEAYAAMYRFLEHEYEMTGSDDIGGMLGSMSLLEGGWTADPAAWSDWLESVSKVLDGDNDIGLQITSD